MIPKVLIVDDDRSQLRLMEKEMDGYADFFSVVTVEDGASALKILLEKDISVVICDLRMPGIDGFELINRIINQYPDIPVMAMTAYGRPKTNDVVINSGAAYYFTKPIDSIVLFDRIVKMIGKKTEGGSLHRVSLEAYLQLVEMEEQTCTLRITRASGDKTGVLFFHKGRLMEARIANRMGLDAAYEILSWSGVSLSIENDCAVSEKSIEGELQAILLDAMRSKDEGMNPGPEPDPADERAAEPEPGPDFEKKPDTNKNQRAGEKAADTTAPPEHNKPAASAANKPVSNTSLSPVEMVGKKLASAMGDENGILDVYSDPKWSGLVYMVENLGQLFESGALNVIYINRKNRQLVIIPEDENVVVVLDKNAPREGVISVFT